MLTLYRVLKRVSTNYFNVTDGETLQTIESSTGVNIRINLERESFALIGKRADVATAKEMIKNATVFAYLLTGLLVRVLSLHLLIIFDIDLYFQNNRSRSTYNH